MTRRIKKDGGGTFCLPASKPNCPTISIFTLLLPMFFFLACRKIPRGTLPTPPGFSWQGHRGSRGLMPENSIPAFLKALEYPEVNTLELDLAVSKDNQLIVSHEPWFNASICLKANGDSIRHKEEQQFLLYQMTAEAIRGFDCGSLGNPRFPGQQKQKTWKPTLREVVEAVRAKRPDKAATIHWNIEIKSQPAWDGLRHPPIEAFCELVMTELKALGIENQANLQSFDVRPLQYLHRAHPSIKLALLVENIRGLDYNLSNLGFQPDIYSPYYRLVSRKTLKTCHQKGIQVIPWTVNEVKDMRALLHLGVDGIITDYPDRIRAATL